MLRDPIRLNREQLQTQIGQDGRVPPPLALLFSMAENTVKRLEGPGNQAWFIVALDDIAPGETDETLIASFQRELSGTVGEEYREQFRIAARNEIGVERNEDAIEALRARLLGQNN